MLDLSSFIYNLGRRPAREINIAKELKIKNSVTQQSYHYNSTGDEVYYLSQHQRQQLKPVNRQSISSEGVVAYDRSRKSQTEPIGRRGSKVTSLENNLIADDYDKNSRRISSGGFTKKFPSISQVGVADIVRKNSLSNQTNIKLPSTTMLTESSNSSSNVTSNNSILTNNSQSTSMNTIVPLPAKSVVICCDKCDGKHLTENCPYYKKKREDHPDAQKKDGKKIGGTSLLPGSYLSNAKVVRQPGDGSCLFHSMSYGLRNNITASRLRMEICNFIQNSPNLKICDTPLKDWVKWDSGSSCVDYARNMSRGAWGGGIEIACVSILKECNVHVYERNGYLGGFKRISAFDHPIQPETKPIIRLLYRGGVHYGKSTHHSNAYLDRFELIVKCFEC